MSRQEAREPALPGRPPLNACGTTPQTQGNTAGRRRPPTASELAQEAAEVAQDAAEEAAGRAAEAAALAGACRFAADELREVQDPDEPRTVRQARAEARRGRGRGGP